ncbi:MAG TPA: hypothetical protein P5081_09150 [Phycisphaerae bacterium]|nr:hypothetical protein [Phycisphaerae bacterium]HRW53043.1 hypothetical protein [Phycisphaerae bacterium]
MAETLTYQPTLFDEATSMIRGGVYRVARVPYDDSETEDIILVRQALERSGAPTTSDTADGVMEDDSDLAPIERATTTVAAGATGSKGATRRPPRRIGNGTLVSTRVQWRPGDPFGQAARAPARGFQWTRMFRSACVTAGSGLILVWLLHLA